MSPALERPLGITVFPNLAAMVCTELSIPLTQFCADLTRSTAVNAKEHLPLFSMGRFGDRRSAKGSLRHQANMQTVDGVVLDHDAGTISIEQAAAIFAAADVPAVILSTPRYTPQMPKWRAILPLGTTCSPEQYETLVSRAAGLFPPDVAFDPKSWERSQSYFFGALNGSQVLLTATGSEKAVPIDLRVDLDATSRARFTTRETRGNGTDHLVSPIEENVDPYHVDDGGSFDLIACIDTIQTGAPGMHDTLVSLCWHYATYDLPEAEIIVTLQGIYQGARAPEHQDERWQRDYRDIARTVRSAVEKVAAQRTEKGAQPQAPLPEQWTPEAQAALAAADAPDPLLVPARPQDPYPIEGMPTFFADPILATARVVEADLSMTGTVGLAAMATAVAKLAPGIEIESGLVFPGNLFTASITPSSERKTSVERRLFSGANEFVVEDLTPEYNQRQREYEARLAVYERDKRALLSARRKAKKEAEAAAEASEDFATGEGSSSQDAVVALLGLEKPHPPVQPNLIVNDLTVEGVRDGLVDGSGQISVVTSEGAMLFGGYSLGDRDRRIGGVGTLSRFWDGDTLTVVRAGRRLVVENPRVSMSIGVQPAIAAKFFNDPLLIDQGIVNRFLLTFPQTLAGKRRHLPPDPGDLALIAEFNEQAKHCLRQAHDLDPAALPRVSPLAMSLEARAAWRAFAREMEPPQGKGGRFETVIGWAGKAAEQAARIALILTLFHNPKAETVELQELEAGIALARWYAGEWLRITERTEPSQEKKAATRVLEWLRAKFPEKPFIAKDIYTAEVAGIRTREPADAALRMLAEHGYIVPLDPPKPSRRGGRPSPTRWRIKP